MLHIYIDSTEHVGARPPEVDPATGQSLSVHDMTHLRGHHITGSCAKLRHRGIRRVAVAVFQRTSALRACLAAEEQHARVGACYAARQMHKTPQPAARGSACRAEICRRVRSPGALRNDGLRTHRTKPRLKMLSYRILPFPHCCR